MIGFDKYLKKTLDLAGIEARQDGSTTVEAQHLLLAIAADSDSTASRVLAAAGLDHDVIREALNREFEHSLNAAGVSLSAFDVAPASPDPQRVPRPGASIQLALERAVKSAAHQDLQPAHLLLGIVQAEVGTVPRALALADVDRTDLIARIREALKRQAKR